MGAFGALMGLSMGAIVGPMFAPKGQRLPVTIAWGLCFVTFPSLSFCISLSLSVSLPLSLSLSLSLSFSLTHSLTLSLSLSFFLSPFLCVCLGYRLYAHVSIPYTCSHTYISTRAYSWIHTYTSAYMNSHTTYIQSITAPAACRAQTNACTKCVMPVHSASSL